MLWIQPHRHPNRQPIRVPTHIKQHHNMTPLGTHTPEGTHYYKRYDGHIAPIRCRDQPLLPSLIYAADRMQLGRFHPIIWFHPHINPPTSWPLFIDIHSMDLDENFQKTAFWQKVENLYNDLIKKKNTRISRFHSSYPALMISTHICSNGGRRGVLLHICWFETALLANI